MTKCALERPKCRKMCMPKISQNRLENVLVLEKQWAHDYCHIGFPKSCYDSKHAEVSGVSRWVEVKDDQSYTKNFQDGSPRVTLGNGPKQD